MDFPLSLTLRIDWSEQDYFRHVNNLAYYKYYQTARLHLFDTIGLSQHHTATNQGPILAAAECQFKRQLHYPGTVTIRSRVTWLKNSSFGLEHHLLNEAGEIAGIAQEVIVYFDFNEQHKLPLTDAFRAGLEGLR